MDDDNDLLDNDLDGDTGSDGGDDGAPPDDQSGDGGGKESKRISDLMSKWQKAENRAKAAEAALAKSKKGAGGETEGDDMPPQVKQWMQLAQESARERLYNSDPRFAEYGIQMEAIAGDTPDAMQASAKTYRDLIDAIETKARNQIMTEHGIFPESVGSTRGQAKDFASMSDEEFEKEVRRYSAGSGF